MAMKTTDVRGSLVRAAVMPDPRHAPSPEDLVAAQSDPPESAVSREERILRGR